MVRRTIFSGGTDHDQSALEYRHSGFQPKRSEYPSESTAPPSLPLPSPAVFPSGSEISPFGTDEAAIDWDTTLKDPSGWLNDTQIEQHLLARFDGNPPKNLMGRPLPETEAQRAKQSWRDTVARMSPDMRDIAFGLQYRHDQVLREKANRTIFRNWLDRSRHASALTEKTQSSDISSSSRQIPVVKASRLRDGESFPGKIQRAIERGLGYGSRVHGRDGVVTHADESMMPAYRLFGEAIEDALGRPSAINAYGARPVTHADESMMPAYRLFGEAIENAIGRPSVINGYGTRPIGYVDQSMAPLEEALFRSMKHQAVADTVQAMTGPIGFSGDTEKDGIPLEAFIQGVKKRGLKNRSTFYSFASVVGRWLHDLVGGDPIALEKTEADIARMEKELKAIPSLTLDDIWVEGDSEKTGENLTIYLYQTMGDQLLNLPITLLLARIRAPGVAEMISTAYIASRINAGLIDANQRGDHQTATLYAIPLGALAMLKIPTKIPDSVKNRDDFRYWLLSQLVNRRIEQWQDEGIEDAIKQNTNRDNGLNRRQDRLNKSRK